DRYMPISPASIRRGDLNVYAGTSGRRTHVDEDLTTTCDGDAHVGTRAEVGWGFGLRRVPLCRWILQLQRLATRQGASEPYEPARAKSTHALSEQGQLRLRHVDGRGDRAVQEVEVPGGDIEDDVVEALGHYR